jgi:hypothetical protein
LVAVTVKVDEPPDVIEVGLAVRLTVGAAGVVLTVRFRLGDVMPAALAVIPVVPAATAVNRPPDDVTVPTDREELVNKQRFPCGSAVSQLVVLPSEYVAVAVS